MAEVSASDDEPFHGVDLEVYTNICTFLNNKYGDTQVLITRVSKADRLKYLRKNFNSAPEIVQLANRTDIADNVTVKYNVEFSYANAKLKSGISKGFFEQIEHLGRGLVKRINLVPNETQLLWTLSLDMYSHVYIAPEIETGSTEEVSPLNSKQVAITKYAPTSFLRKNPFSAPKLPELLTVPTKLIASGLRTAVSYAIGNDIYEKMVSALEKDDVSEVPIVEKRIKRGADGRDKTAAPLNGADGAPLAENVVQNTYGLQESTKRQKLN